MSTLVFLARANTSAVLVEHLDQLVQVLVADDALPRSGGVEVGDVNHASQPRVLPRDAPYGIGEGFAQSNCGQCQMCPPQSSVLRV